MYNGNIDKKKVERSPFPPTEMHKEVNDNFRIKLLASHQLNTNTTYTHARTHARARRKRERGNREGERESEREEEREKREDSRRQFHSNSSTHHLIIMLFLIKVSAGFVIIPSPKIMLARDDK